jgi:hypothetical protein
METIPVNENTPKKFHVIIGNKVAHVEVISLTEQIYSVEVDGGEPIFITRIKDKKDKACWISIPQGNNDLAVSVGDVIERLRRERQ